MPATMFPPNVQVIQADANKSYEQMKAQGKVLVSDGKDDGWVAAKERGYVNCLLTMMGEGKLDSIVIKRNGPLPQLMDLVKGKPVLEEWAKSLRFDYKSLSSAVVIDTLLHSANVGASQPAGTFPAVLARMDGRPQLFVFAVQKINSNGDIAVTPWWDKVDQLAPL